MKTTNKIMSKVRRQGVKSENLIIQNNKEIVKNNSKAWDLELKGKKIEVKTSRYRIIHHGYMDYGRFKIIVEHHKELLKAKGYYVFVIRMGRGIKRRYFICPAKKVENELKISKRYTESAGISTNWVFHNCKQVNKSDIEKVVK